MIEDAFIYRKAPIHQPFSSPHLRHVWRLSSIKEYPPSPMPFILMRFILMGFIVDVTIIPDKIKKPDLSMKEAGFFSVYAALYTPTSPTAPGTPRSERPESPDSPR